MLKAMLLVAYLDLPSVRARGLGPRDRALLAPMIQRSENAADQARYLLHIDSLIAPRHRAYAMRLLNAMTLAQRWGIARVRPPGWRLYFKGG